MAYSSLCLLVGSLVSWLLEEAGHDAMMPGVRVSKTDLISWPSSFLPQWSVVGRRAVGLLGEGGFTPSR